MERIEALGNYAVFSGLFLILLGILLMKTAWQTQHVPKAVTAVVMIGVGAWGASLV